MAFPDRRALLRYLVRGVLGLLVLVVVAVGAVVLVAATRIGESHEVAGHFIPIPDDAASIAEGGRMAAYWGCTGCHERNAGGGIFFESPLGDRLVAPNLTRIVREYNVRELERAIRHGVGRDGRSLVVMPSSMFTDMSDDDLGRVIAYLRSLPPVPDTLPGRRLAGMAHFFVFLDASALEAVRIDQEASHPTRPAPVDATSPREDSLALGEYLARTGCPECHGLDLRGRQDGAIPDLRIAAAYTPEKFRTLMREGIALDGQERGLMTEIARGRVDRLTDAELGSLHAYLRTLAD
jgi:mono/diheme cytochrome c family protein